MMDRSTPPANSSPTALRATVTGLFHLRSGAEAAIRELREARFTDREIGIALRDRGERHRFRTLGSLFVPGIGPIAVGGVLALGLAGGGVGGATGGIAGALMGLGVPESAARHFDRGLRTGAVLVAVAAGTDWRRPSPSSGATMWTSAPPARGGSPSRPRRASPAGVPPGRSRSTFC